MFTPPEVPTHPEPRHETQRLHALDALRAVAMLLGILFHAGIAYSNAPRPNWPVIDPAHSRIIEVLLLCTHAFRMHLFFFVAGFFVAMLVQRRGPAGMLKNRSLRILFPYVLGLVTIIPLLGISINFSAWFQTGPALRPGVLSALLGRAPGFKGLWQMADAHLWFLRHLFFYCLVAASCAVVARLWPSANLSAHRDAAIGWWVRSWPLRALVAAAITGPVQWLWQLGAPTPGQQPLQMFASYACFFAAGYLIHRRRDDLPRLAGWWWVSLLAALPVAGLLAASVWLAKAASVPSPLLGRFTSLPAHFTLSLVSWLLVLGLTGFFLRFANNPSRWSRYLADASYWLYLAHLPVVFAIGALATTWPMGAIPKLAIVCALSLGVLLVLYQLLVRRTPIGWLLNGRRT